jgi:hypothetical protein
MKHSDKHSDANVKKVGKFGQRLGLAVTAALFPSIFAACSTEPILAPPRNAQVIDRPLKLSPREAVNGIQRRFLADVLEGWIELSFPSTMFKSGDYSDLEIQGWISSNEEKVIEGMCDLSGNELVFKVPKNSEILLVDIVLKDKLTMTSSNAFSISSEITNRIIIPSGSKRYGGCEDTVYLPGPDSTITGLRTICTRKHKYGEKRQRWRGK